MSVAPWSSAAPTSGQPRLVAIIPAHDEATMIGAALDGLYAQTVRPDVVLVVADTCTDATARIAVARGALVTRTLGNRGRKAGALNQVLASVLPWLDGRDLVLIQDADTILTPRFVQDAAGVMNRRVGAVGGVFHGQPGGGLLGLLQRMEFERYARQTHRHRDRAWVLTGTATLFRAHVLREVRAARRTGRLPGGDSFYDPASPTEDDEITKAIKTLGYRAVSPAGCGVTTEVMPTVRALWRQRLRWQRGAQENLRAYGLTRITLPYASQQAAIGFGVLAFATYLTYMVLMLVMAGRVAITPLWAGIGLLFAIERMVSARAAGGRAMLLAALLLPEMVYDVLMQAVYVAALWGALRRRPWHWHPT